MLGRIGLSGAASGPSLWRRLGAGLGRSLSTSLVRSGGGPREFVAHQERLSNKRVADLFHFYVVCLGAGPWAILAFVQAIVWGRCRLEPLPEDRVPRYWEYEETPWKQFRARYLHKNPVLIHEVHQGQWFWYDLKKAMILRYRRMEHLIGQRMDYKAIFQKSSRAHWIEVSEYFKEEALHNMQDFHHSPDATASTYDISGIYYS